MISNKDFLAFLNEKSLDLSKETLENMIDEELEKPINEMDADLIEYCLDALNELESNNQIKSNTERKSDVKKKYKLTTFRKILIAAVVAIIVCLSSLSVFAVVNNVSIFDGIIELYDKYIIVRFDKIDDKAEEYKLLGTELSQKLKENGIYPVLLPEALLSEESQITDIVYQTGDFHISADISFVYGKEKGFVSITCFDPGIEIGESDYPNAKYKTTIDVNGIQIHIFEQNRKGTITFKDGQIEYTIISSMDVEQAIEFAKTIK